MTRRLRPPVAVALAAVALSGLGATAIALRGGGEEPAPAAEEWALARPAPEPVAHTPVAPVPRRPREASAAPVPPSTAPAVATRTAESPPEETAGAEGALSDDRLDKPAFDAAGRRLPAGGSWALPPLIRLRAAPTAVAEPAQRLAARVLASRRLALAPAARRNVERGRVTAAGLALLLELRGSGPPLLVHVARGRELRVQETTLALTRRSVARLDALPAGRAPAALRLKAARADLADAGRVHADAGSPGSIGRAAADLALQYLGIPYVWGGATPQQGMDCSGLVQYVYGRLGIPLTHYAAFQFREGDPVASTDLRPGDLVFFNPKADGPGHVGIYIGNGQMVHAPRTGDVIRVADLSSRASRYMGAVRVY